MTSVLQQHETHTLQQKKSVEFFLSVADLQSTVVKCTEYHSVTPPHRRPSLPVAISLLCYTNPSLRSLSCLTDLTGTLAKHFRGYNCINQKLISYPDNILWTIHLIPEGPHEPISLPPTELRIIPSES
ncbi:hypothetical protein NPIL_49521, partial [Nephila pilipes]